MTSRGRTVLVTGAAGFAGSHLLERLAGRCELVAWSRSAPPDELVSLARWTRIDLLDRDHVRNEIRQLAPDGVFHLAGASQVGSSWQKTAAALSGNVLATHYLLDAIRRAGIPCRVLVTGSASVYAPSLEPLSEGDALAPGSPYGLSKLAQEQAALGSFQDDGLDIVMTRPFNHTGPRQRPDFAAPSIARQIALAEIGAAAPRLRVGNLDTQRDLTDVRDTVRAYESLMDLGTPGTVYNIASGTPRPMRAVLDALRERSPIPVDVEVDPGLLRPTDAPVVVGNATRLRELAGWAPAIGFDRMMDDLLDYWRRTVRT